jgi:hypothetical protein
VVWRVSINNVSYQAYKELLDHAVKFLPEGVRVVFLADRGFADTELIEHVRKLGAPSDSDQEKLSGILRRAMAQCG